MKKAASARGVPYESIDIASDIDQNITGNANIVEKEENDISASERALVVLISVAVNGLKKMIGNF